MIRVNTNKAHRRVTHKSVLLWALLTIIISCGCGKDEEVDLASPPSIDEYDAGFSQAHFISAPEDFSNVSRIEGYENWPTEYQLSYDMKLDSDSACFVLSDGGGQYGQGVLLRLSLKEDGCYFELRTMDGGKITPLSEPVIVEDTFFYGEDSDIDLNEDFGIDEVAAPSWVNSEFVVSASVSEGQDSSQLLVSINDIDLGVFEIPSFKLGAIGLYKERDSSYAYLDNIFVESADGDVLYEEDFETQGADAASFDNIFSPYYTYVTEGMLRVDPGFILTKLEGTPAPVFIKDFECNSKKLEHAYIYMTALGAVDISIDGNRVSDNFLDPGHLEYADHLSYVSYDVTDIIKQNQDSGGVNGEANSGNQHLLSITLLHGFYDRGQCFPEQFAPYGDALALKGELVLVNKDGSTNIIPTDSSFQVSDLGTVLMDDVYQGEILDGKSSDIESLVSSVSFDSSDVTMDLWPVRVNAVDAKYISMPIEPKESEVMGTVEDRIALSVSEPEPGVYVYDFGQNASGNIYIGDRDATTLSIVSPSLSDYGVSEGDTITFRYGEILNSEDLACADDIPGTVWILGYLTANSTDYYYVGDASVLGTDSLAASPDSLVSGGQIPIDFRHTYHGFRYLQISGLDKPFPIEKVHMRVLSSMLTNTGEFSCSNENINNLLSNAKYGIMSNFMDNPTDCNQRDERLGWAGDAQNTCGTASYMFDTHRFYDKYLRALRDTQNDGAFCDTAPETIAGFGNNCWGDAAVVIAWNTYLQYGDIGILEDDYEACAKWVDYLENTSEGYIRYKDAYGDHLSHQSTSKELSDTAWCAHSADLVSKMAKALGREEDAKHYTEVYEAYRAAWLDRYWNPEGSVAAGLMYEESETAYALGIMFGLFGEDKVKDASDRLAMLGEYSGYVFYPGYSGLSFLLPALSRYGNEEAAMHFLENTAPGSLMYPQTLGMTTMPEDLMTLGINENGQMYINGSMNHQAYAGVCSFMYSDILGIRPDEACPGYEHFYLEPQIGGTLQNASGYYDSVRGRISVNWSKDEGGVVTLSFAIPEGSTCTLIAPSGERTEYSSGEYEVKW